MSVTTGILGNQPHTHGNALGNAVFSALNFRIFVTASSSGGQFVQKRDFRWLFKMHTFIGPAVNPGYLGVCCNNNLILNYRRRL